MSSFSDFNSILFSLKKDSQPSWGHLSSQEMIEHLIATTQMSSGGKKIAVITPPDKIEKAKSFIYSKAPMPKNFKAPFFINPPPLFFSSLKEACLVLKKEVAFFHSHFKKDPVKKTNGLKKAFQNPF